MTVQLLDSLICEHPRIDLSDYKIDSETLHPSLSIPLGECNVPPETQSGVSSNLWRGYLATFRLNANGSFELIQIEFPNYRPPYKQNFALVYEGDFSVRFQKQFGWNAPSITIPFVNGLIVEDESTWATNELPSAVRSHDIEAFGDEFIASFEEKLTRICSDLGMRDVSEIVDRMDEFLDHPEANIGELDYYLLLTSED